jgi:hypothetical protein
MSCFSFIYYMKDQKSKYRVKCNNFFYLKLILLNKNKNTIQVTQ